MLIHYIQIMDPVIRIINLDLINYFLPAQMRLPIELKLTQPDNGYDY